MKWETQNLQTLISFSQYEINVLKEMDYMPVPEATAFVSYALALIKSRRPDLADDAYYNDMIISGSNIFLEHIKDNGLIHHLAQEEKQE